MFTVITFLQNEKQQNKNHLKSNDKTKSNSQEFPIEECVGSIVVSVSFISVKIHKQCLTYRVILDVFEMWMLLRRTNLSGSAALCW